MGPNTWALLICLLFFGAGGWLMSRGLLLSIAGALLSSAALGTIISIICYQGAVVPGTNMPAGKMVGLVALGLFGVALTQKPKTQAAERMSLRGQIPTLGTSSIVAFVLGAVLIIVPVLLIFNSLDLSLGDSGQGLDRATRQIGHQNKSTLRSIEEFLAR